MDVADEMNELKEHAEEAHERGMMEISLTMAVLAVIIALFTMLGHRAHTEEGVLQTKAADQWSYFQGKDTREFETEIALKMYQLNNFKGEDKEKIRSEWETTKEKYTDQLKEIQAEARKLESEVKLQGDRATRFDYGESLVAIALVVTSICLMTGRRVFWHAGMLIAALGTVLGLSAFLLH